MATVAYSIAVNQFTSYRTYYTSVVCYRQARNSPRSRDYGKLRSTQYKEYWKVLEYRRLLPIQTNSNRYISSKFVCLEIGLQSRTIVQCNLCIV